MTPYQEFIYVSRYSRWNNEKKRRETWPETVTRYVEYFKPRIPKDLREKTSKEIYDAIYYGEVMPSMRAFWSAGPALDRDNVAGYNCAYLAIDNPRAFDEAMYISMCGTGVGFSVERQYITHLPVIAEEFFESNTVIKIQDSRIGWARGFKELISLLYGGMIPKWDLSLLRPAGAVLKTFGGRSSGPGPLDELFRFTVYLFKEAAGRKLTSIECHDLLCKIASVVVAGGVRRSAMISLSNLSDDRMRDAKTGKWWDDYQHRELANNSAVFTDKPDMGIFLKEWTSLYESKSGERGIFNREAAKLQAAKNERRVVEDIEFGTNPCGEILLRSCQFCNLSEVVIREDDDLESLKRKVRIAAIIGTLQSTVTDFRYLRPIWKKNCEAERLLGVSLTGIMDNRLTVGGDLKDTRPGGKLAETLDALRKVAITTNKKWADNLGIKQSAAITCVKPSGTVSQLMGCSSGIHPSYSRHYLRAVRNASKDPVSELLKASGVPSEPGASTAQNVDVFYFPVKAAESSVIRTEITALQQLDLYLVYREHWCEHNPSCTVYVRGNEWLDVASWVYRNFDKIGGISFLPYSDDGHIYKQAPYSEMSEVEYNQRVKDMPKIDWTKLQMYETIDNTSGSLEPACSSGQCDL
jgi:ribonucleoside-diphosphate reductase alpha chain